MPKIDVYDTTAKKTSKIQLPKEIFEAKINEQLMAQAVRVYLANQRKARAKTKSRGEVVGSRRKIYRQKGTGQARHADRYAPIFVGGGIAHGPKGKLKRLKMPKKMRRLALFSALTTKLKERKIIVVRGLEKIKPKTKEMVKIMQNFKLEGRILLVPANKIENIIRAARNIANIKLIQANQLNTYEVLRGRRLILTKDSIKTLKETFLS